MPSQTLARAFALLILGLSVLPGFAASFFQNYTTNNLPWSGGLVPYAFDPSLTAEMQRTYVDGIKEWELVANVHFFPRSNQTSYLLLKYDPNAPQNTISGSNPTIMTLGNLTRSQICHEMGHGFGFSHEHIRPDRDLYVRILTNNVKPQSLGELYNIGSNDVPYGPYDFQSVMHYARNAGAIDSASDTIQVRPGYERFQTKLGNRGTLSQGDRAAAVHLFGAGPVLSPVVTTTKDGGVGSLRAAIYFANDNPGTTITFNIPASDSGYSNGVFNIQVTGLLPLLVADSTTIDATTQPGFSNHPIVVLSGEKIIPEALGGVGFFVYAANCRIRGLVINRFSNIGLQILYPEATNNVIEGCYIGTDPWGTNAAPNAFEGIAISGGACNNLIGGTNASQRNLISGHPQFGVVITGTNTMSNVVSGNYVGTDITGTRALANGNTGVAIWDGSSSNVIGGVISGAGNLLSGNGEYGLFILGVGSLGNVVQGNRVGTDSSGVQSLPNGLHGVGILSGAASNRIGGTVAGARNILSGNASCGILIYGVNTTSNIVEGNFAGTDFSGTNRLANGNAGVGIWGGAYANLIGGGLSAARNLLSGNGQYGVLISDVATVNNEVQGNYVGIDVTGARSLSNSLYGIGLVNGASSNLIGGTLFGTGNIISGNANSGVIVFGANTGDNLIQGNFIGTDPNGQVAITNGNHGVLVGAGATRNVIGANTVGGGNLISGNRYDGIHISDLGTVSNRVLGNLIGVNVNGASKIPNGLSGVGIVGGASQNQVGGLAATDANILSGNGLCGIFLQNTNTTGNSVCGNCIGTDTTGQMPLANGFAGVYLGFGASTNFIGFNVNNVGRANKIAFNASSGIFAEGSGTFANTIRGNNIYSNASLGINLVGGAELGNGSTANDSGDLDTGPNNLQNYPTLTSVTIGGGFATIHGALNSSSNRSFVLDFYRSSRTDTFGFAEGENFLASGQVASGPSGKINFAFALPNPVVNGYFTATATDVLTGDTSEFSPAMLGTNGPAPPAISSCSITSNKFQLVLSVTPGESYRIQLATNLAIPNWIDLTNFPASTNIFRFTNVLNSDAQRFYRVLWQ